jgi:hypothetical protein
MDLMTVCREFIDSTDVSAGAPLHYEPNHVHLDMTWENINHNYNHMAFAIWAYSEKLGFIFLGGSKLSWENFQVKLESLPGGDSTFVGKSVFNAYPQKSESFEEGKPLGKVSNIKNFTHVLVRMDSVNDHGHDVTFKLHPIYHVESIPLSPGTNYLGGGNHYLVYDGRNTIFVESNSIETSMPVGGVEVTTNVKGNAVSFQTQEVKQDKDGETITSSCEIIKLDVNCEVTLTFQNVGCTTGQFGQYTIKATENGLLLTKKIEGNCNGSSEILLE